VHGAEIHVSHRRAGIIATRRRGAVVTSREARRSITPAPYFTVAERAARGAAARADVPRRSHGDWAPSPHRPDPVELLEEQAADESPSSFRSVTGGCSRRRLRSSAAYLMASDLAGQPRSGLHAQLCGDATPGCARARWLGPMLARETRLRSRANSAKARASAARWPRSPSSMPTRTSWTMRRSSPPPAQVGSMCRAATQRRRP
jgi:hypothetical protein